LPPEIFAVSGNELIEKLQRRRDQLPAFAKTYYEFIAIAVDVPGSKKREYFEVKPAGESETLVQVFRMNKEGEKHATPLYTRTFNSDHTKEIRLYGIDGEDVYAIHGTSPGIKLRVIGGDDKDSIIQYGSDRIHVYDNEDNIFKTTNARLHTSNDSSIHAYNYEGHNYNVQHVIPYIFFNNNDLWYAGLNYSFVRHRWRRQPYANKRTIGVNYYGQRRAISASIAAVYPNRIGKWDINLFAEYDAIRWTNYFGTGNETKLLSTDRTYHRMRSKDWTATAGIGNEFGKSSLLITGMYQRVKIINDTARYIAKIIQQPSGFEASHYGGLQFTYSFLSTNDSIVPTSGLSFMGKATVLRNFSRSDIFQNYSARMQAYIPFGSKMSLAIRAGTEAIVGNKATENNGQLYQHAIIGGPANMRGYRAERFWGKTSFYNQNELRFITNIRSYLLNAKAGLLVFFDDGRVWTPGEVSNTLHTSYGGGILVAPFNKLSATFTYGITKETSLMQLSIGTLF
jgi:hypothetical protein